MIARALRNFNRSTNSSFFAAFCASLLIVFFFWSHPPITLGFDPNKEKCITDLHLSLLLKFPPKEVHDGQLVIFRPNMPLSYVRQDFVLKQVAGVGGDHLQVARGQISINGRVVATGLPLASLYRRKPAELERDEIIPVGRVFLVGNNPKSDDSRYWGYLQVSQLAGTAIKLF